MPFNFIDLPDVQQDIVRAHLKRITGEFEDKYRAEGHRLYFDDSVVAWLVASCGQQMAEFGGRGITNALQREIMLPLARAMLRMEYSGRHGVALHVRLEPSQGVVVREGSVVA